VYHQKHTIPTVKHGGGSMMLLHSGPERLLIAESKMNSVELLIESAMQQ